MKTKENARLASITVSAFGQTVDILAKDLIPCGDGFLYESQDGNLYIPMPTKQAASEQGEIKMTWQELINEVYEYWKENDVEYGELLEYTRGRYGELGELAILIKNYNYQVENGGHLQYFDNGYCDGKSGAFSDKDKTIPLHHRMIELFEKFNLHTTEEGKPVYEVMQAFAGIEFTEAYEEEFEEECDCPDCGGMGFLDEDEVEICGNCSGMGFVYEWSYESFDDDVHIPGHLDDDYYAVNADFIAFFEGFVYAMMSKNTPKASLDKQKQFGILSLLITC